MSEAVLVREKFLDVLNPVYEKILKTRPEKRDGFNPELVLILSQKGEQKIPLDINSAKFTRRIKAYTWVFLNSKRGICCILPETWRVSTGVLKALLRGIPLNFLIWVGIPLALKTFGNATMKFIDQGFSDPYISALSPCGAKIPLSLCLARKNVITERVLSGQEVLNSCIYAIEQARAQKTSDAPGTCFLTARLSEDAVKFLKNTSYMGVSEDDSGDRSQKELTGELKVVGVPNSEIGPMFLIDVVRGSVESGEEENVDVKPTRYNFHSHPKEAYVRHSVNKAWPSVTDYLGYLTLGSSTIFHCVAAIEGIYVISFGTYWVTRLKEVDRDFIEKNYHVDQKERYSPQEYTSKINSILYKGHPIYEVRFSTWEEATEPFRVYYSQEGGACLITQKGVEIHKKFHKED